MKLSEFINQLTDTLKTNGDLEVLVFVSDFEFDIPTIRIQPEMSIQPAVVIIESAL